MACVVAACLGIAGPVLVRSGPAWGAPVKFDMTPGTVEVGFRAYGLGLLAFDGEFTRFTGTLTLDDADPSACTLAMRADAASLRMPRQSMTDDALGPDLLDVTHFPEFSINGRCEGTHIQAMLLLHGVTRPVTMDVSIDKGRWAASGTMHRADWGMGARPLLAGPEVRVSVKAGIPPGFPTRRGSRS